MVTELHLLRRMLLSAMLLFLFNGNTAFAQILPERIRIDGMTLYHENGEKMTKQEIEDLAQYGFDSDQYFKLKKINRYATASIYLGAAMLGVGGFIGRNDEHLGLAASLEVAGPILGLSGLIICNRINPRIDSLLGSLESQIQVGFTPSGASIVLHF